MQVVFYKTPAGNEPVRAWLKKQPKEERKEIGVELLKVQLIYPDAGMPLVEPIDKRLWAVRVSLRDHWARVLFTVKNKTIILLHGVMKKTNKLDRDDIELAQDRLKDL